MTSTRYYCGFSASWTSDRLPARRRNDLEISCAELERLRGILAGDNEIYTESVEAIDEILSEANIMRERITEALYVMITCCGQNDSLVHIFSIKC